MNSNSEVIQSSKKTITRSELQRRIQACEDLRRELKKIGKAIKSANEFNESSGQSENCITAVTRSVFMLEFVNESNFDKLVDCIKKCIKSSYSDGAIDICILVSYSDDHPFRLNGFFSAYYQTQIVNYLPVKISYLLIGNQSAFHHVTPGVFKNGSVPA